MKTGDKLLSILFLLVTLLLNVGLGLTQDDSGEQSLPNDPAVNDEANACFPGGSMEGQCDTEWEMVCGWYIIRLDPQDEASRASFPEECVTLLPPIVIQSSKPLESQVQDCYEAYNGIVFWDFGC